jgi:Lon protease-like protein
MTIDTGNAWQVCFALLQLLPVDSATKYQLLELNDIDELVEALDEILSELSG